MGLFSSFRNISIKNYNFIRKYGTYFGELISLIERRHIWIDCKLTEEEKKAANSFYESYYGKKVPLYWHRLYKAYSGKFDPQYVPEYLYSTKMEELLNPYLVTHPLENKSFNPQVVFGNIHNIDNVKIPKMYITDCKGVIWNDDGKILNLDKAIEAISNIGACIIKPTIESMGGRSVRILELHNGIDLKTNQDINTIIKSYEKDYIIQERIYNHKTVSKLYDKSINTFRVITYICNDKIFSSPIMMRIGVGGKEIDSYGIYVGISDSGVLNDFGISKASNKPYFVHPDSGVVFKGYEIDKVPEIISVAKKLHSKLPQLRIISWDLAYADDESIVVIEVNATGQSIWLPQIANGKSAFGENTKDMLNLLK